MDLKVKLHRNKRNGQLNIMLPKKKLRIKDRDKFMVIKDFKFIEED